MKYWEKIVVLRLDGKNTEALTINDSREAARVLLRVWPTRRGRSYRRAVLSCSAALHGRVSQDAAQWAFIVAAMEAAIPFEISDRLDAEIAAVCRELLEQDLMQRPSARSTSIAAAVPDVRGAIRGAAPAGPA